MSAGIPNQGDRSSTAGTGYGFSRYRRSSFSEKARNVLEEKMAHRMKTLAVVGILTALPLLITASAFAYTCSVRSPVQTISFGNLDPGVGTDAVATATIRIRCTGIGGGGGVTFDITDDDGLSETGLNGNRMINAGCPLGTAYLPYSFTYTTPVSGAKNTNIPVTFTGMVLGTIYQNACVGAYSDTVTITIAP